MLIEDLKVGMIIKSDSGMTMKAEYMYNYRCVTALGLNAYLFYISDGIGGTDVLNPLNKYKEIKACMSTLGDYEEVVQPTKLYAYSRGKHVIHLSHESSAPSGDYNHDSLMYARASEFDIVVA